MLKSTIATSRRIASKLDPVLLTRNRSRLGFAFYFILLVSLVAGATGSAGDSSWHFSRFFDEISIPHLLTVVGDLINVCLLVYAFLNNKKLSKGERLGFKLNIAALIVLLVAIPLDLINHLISGIDLTTWSISHLMLFYQGTLLMFGMMLAWVHSVPGQRAFAWLLTLGFALFFFSSFMFPLYQQEYAAVVFHTLQASHTLPWYVAPDLLKEAGPNVNRLLTNGTPPALYVTYQAPMAIVAVFCSLLLFAKQRKTPKGFVAGLSLSVSVVLVYLGFRLAARAVLGYLGWPTAELPVWLIPLSAVIGLAAPIVQRIAGSGRIKWPQVYELGILAMLGAAAGCALFVTLYLMHANGNVSPAAPLDTLPYVAALSGLAPLLTLVAVKATDRA